MGNYSRDPRDESIEYPVRNPRSHYSGVLLQKGVPWLDCDFNEQVLIWDERLKDVLNSLIGSGVPISQRDLSENDLINNLEINPESLDPSDNYFSFLIQPDGDADFKIVAPEGKIGVCFVEGREVFINEPVTYTTQLGSKFETLPDFSVPNDSKLTIYLDVWKREITPNTRIFFDEEEDKDEKKRLSNEDIRLTQPACVRMRNEWCVRFTDFAENEYQLPFQTGHSYHILADVELKDGQLEFSDRRSLFYSIVFLQKAVKKLTQEISTIKDRLDSHNHDGTSSIRVQPENLSGVLPTVSGKNLNQLTMGICNASKLHHHAAVHTYSVPLYPIASVFPSEPFLGRGEGIQGYFSNKTYEGIIPLYISGDAKIKSLEICHFAGEQDGNFMFSLEIRAYSTQRSGYFKIHTLTLTSQEYGPNRKFKWGRNEPYEESIRDYGEYRKTHYLVFLKLSSSDVPEGQRNQMITVDHINLTYEYLPEIRFLPD
jgi:hypothetical protein